MNDLEWKHGEAKADLAEALLDLVGIRAELRKKAESVSVGRDGVFGTVPATPARVEAANRVADLVEAIQDEGPEGENWVSALGNECMKLAVGLLGYGGASELMLAYLDEKLGRSGG